MAAGSDAPGSHGARGTPAPGTRGIGGDGTEGSRSSRRPRSDRVGAYGLTLTGLDVDAMAGPGALQPLSEATAWPSWQLRWSPLAGGADEDGDEQLTPEMARLRAPDGGWTVLDRARAQSCFVTRRPPSAVALVHPYLSSTAVVAGHWLGRTTFHGGVVVVGGRAWMVLGGRQVGKSSLLCGLHLSGVPVMADDLAVVEAGHVLAGPRCLDLRRSAAEHFGVGRSIGTIGRRARWRVDLPLAGTQAPLGGWVVLGWAAAPELLTLSAAERLQVLLAHRALLAPAVVPHRLLELVEYPAWAFARPRRWNRFADAQGRLLDWLASR